MEAFDVVKLALARQWGRAKTLKTMRCQTPLHIASRRGVVALVRCLLKAGAEVNVQDRDGKTAMDVASNNKHLEVVQLLTEHVGQNIGTVSAG